jgi:hypothetical protein
LDASGTTGEILIIALHYCSGMDHGKSSLDRSDNPDSRRRASP